MTNFKKYFRYSRGKLIWIGDGREPRWAPSGGRPGRRYLACCIEGRKVYYHHIVWLLHHRKLPPTVDHKNGDRSDNRIGNLRAADVTQNLWNSRHYQNNKSGYRGVDLHKQSGRYRARLRIRGREISLGYFATAEAAGAAFRAAAKQHYEGFAK